MIIRVAIVISALLLWPASVWAQITLTSANISVASVDYDGVEHTAKVYYNSTLLNKGTDYTVTGPDVLTNIGSTTFSITGIGNYTGIVSGITFYITKNVLFSSSYEWLTYYDDENDLEVPSGYEVLTVSDASLANKTVTTTALTYIPANVPVILHKTGEALGEYHLRAATGTPPDFYSGFTGVTASTAVTALLGSVQYIIVGDEFVKLDTSEGGSIGANRCYLYFTTGAAPARMNITNETTEVGTIISDVDENWYDLYGRKLSSKPTKKGLYILNNKKVIIK